MFVNDCLSFVVLIIFAAIIPLLGVAAGSTNVAERLPVAKWDFEWERDTPHGTRVFQDFPRTVLCCVLRELAVSGRVLKRARQIRRDRNYIG